MSLFPAETTRLAEQIIALYRTRGWMVATAESCTGGLIAGALTDVSGSSAVIDRGFVTYTNGAKTDLIGVAPATLASFGAVSRETAMQMAHGALYRSKADVAVAVTGIAGPGGGTADKPVGLVHLALKSRSGLVLHRDMHYGEIGRDGVRLATVQTALELLMKAVQTAA